MRISIFTTNLKIWNSENFANLKLMYVKHLVVVTQHVWYIWFVLFPKCFCFISKMVYWIYISLSVLPSFFWDPPKTLCNSFKQSFQIQWGISAITENIEGILSQTSGIILPSRSRMEIRLLVNSNGWLKAFYFIEIVE